MKTPKTRMELLRYFYSDAEGKRHSFTANVIATCGGNVAKRLKGLFHLSRAERVCHAPHDTLAVLIDGKYSSFTELEKFSKGALRLPQPMDLSQREMSIVAV